MANNTDQPSELPAGPWQGLLTHALRLVDEVAARGIRDPFWTFGGGTVLMLRYANLVIGDLLSEVSHLDERIKQYDGERPAVPSCLAPVSF